MNQSQLAMLSYVLVPLVTSNIIHMIIVKKELWKGLAVPVFEKQFGANKTWRGFVVLVVLNAVFDLLINFHFQHFTALNAAFVGASLGFAFAVFELPNSWLKRKLGIAPGTKPKKYAWIFTLIDKSDSVIGVTIVATLFFNFTWMEVAASLLIGIFLHLFISAILYSSRIKSAF